MLISSNLPALGARMRFAFPAVAVFGMSRRRGIADQLLEMDPHSHLQVAHLDRVAVKIERIGNRDSVILARLNGGLEKALELPAALGPRGRGVGVIVCGVIGHTSSMP